MRRRARGGGAEPNGYLLLRKRPGISSFDALNLVKRSFDTGRVGHSGTLDKFAEGLLVVLIGRSTRLVPWFTGCDKVYDGTIAFGDETDTLDPEGSIVASAPAPTDEALREALIPFRGEIMQAPPLYSSIHVNGKRAHEIARSGETVDMKERPITLYSLDLSSYDGHSAKISVHCSKGTYIRSLARDIAYACGSRAHLETLLRTRVAGFELSKAIDPYDSPDPAQAVRNALKPIDEQVFVAIGIPTIRMGNDIAHDVAHGKPFDPARLGSYRDQATVALFLDDGRFAAVLVRENERIKYGYVAIRPEEL